MGIARDLLLQANHLATYEGSDPSQASLRRAVSTVYYALFHLLIEHGAQRWHGSPEPRRALERGFDHGPIKTASLKFRAQTWQDWVGNSRQVPPEVRRVASAFIDLQEDRHTADYDNHEQWSPTEGQAVLNTGRTAFQDWQLIRTDPMAGHYLLAMLLKEAALSVSCGPLCPACGEAAKSAHRGTTVAEEVALPATEDFPSDRPLGT